MKYKILFIINKLNRGGAEKNLFQIASNLVHKNKYEIFVVTLFNKGNFEKPFKDLDIPIINLDIKGSLLLSPLNYYRYYELIRIIRVNKPDIIHSFLFHSNLVAGLLKNCFRNSKLVVTKMGSNFWYKKKHFLSNKFVYRKSDLIMVNTNALKKEILQYVNVENKIIVIPNGIEIDIKKDEIANNDLISKIRESGKIVIGCVGRFVSAKRYQDVIKTAKILAHDLKDIHFVIIGGRGNIDDVKALVNELGLQDIITFIGEVADVYPYIKGFDVFLMASSSEGMPNALMEAMLMGKPIVATNVGGIPDLVEDGENGILVPPLKPDEIAGAIRRLLKDREMMRKFSSNNLVRIKEFSTATMVSRIGEMYNSVLSC